MGLAAAGVELSWWHLMQDRDSLDLELPWLRHLGQRIDNTTGFN